MNVNQTVRARYRDKSVLVTGAGSGIGRAAAVAFASEGAGVIVVDVDAESAAMTVAQIHAAGGRAIATTADVTSAPQCENAVALAVANYGQLDVAFANAGVFSRGRAHEVTTAEWKRVLDVDLTGVWTTARAALRPMLEARFGSIVCTASIAGIRGIPDSAAYAAAKGGVLGLVRQMALDYAADGIRVNAICPGSIRTPMLEASYASPGGPDFSHVANRYPMGRLGKVEEIVDVVLFLGSAESGFITGQEIVVDGGVSIAAWLPGA